MEKTSRYILDWEVTESGYEGYRRDKGSEKGIQKMMNDNVVEEIDNINREWRK